MRAFDLDAAKRGAAVCTRDGLNARIICTDCRNRDSVVALVNYGTFERPSSYTARGEYVPGSHNDLDLFMCDDDYLEKLERGEYTPSVKENLTVENPVVKKNLTTDREYWRRVYAGQAMMGIFAGRSWPKNGALDCINYARNAVELADAMIEELEKKGANCSKGSQSSEGTTK